MPCGQANGPCSIASNGDDCVAPKIYEPTLEIDITTVSGTIASVSVNWTPEPVTTTIIRGYCRDYNNNESAQVNFVPGSQNSMVFLGLTLSTIYRVLIRAETETHYGPWVPVLAYTDNSWDSTKEFVLHRGEFVTHNGELVFI